MLMCVVHIQSMIPMITHSSLLRHLESTVAASRLELSPSDLTAIERVLSRSSGPNGPVFGLERDITGKHGRIMKYTLNQLNMGEHLEELCLR